MAAAAAAVVTATAAAAAAVTAAAAAAAALFTFTRPPLPHRIQTQQIIHRTRLRNSTLHTLNPKP